MARFYNIALIVSNFLNARGSVGTNHIIIIRPDLAFRCGIFEVFIRYLRSQSGFDNG